MLAFVLVLFAVAALVGIGMLSLRSTEQYPPLSLTALHGIPAFVALVLLAIVVLTGNVGGRDVGAYLPASLGVFVLAALGGTGLVVVRWKKEAYPMSWVLAHGGIAVVALVLFMVAVFR